MRIRELSLLAAAPAVFWLAACGGSNGDGIASANGGTASPSASASASASMDPHEAGLKFAQCMRQHGIQMDDPKGGGGQITLKLDRKGVPRTKMEAAQKACQHFLAAGGKQGHKPSAKERDQMLKFAQCMRAHGVNVQDPKPGGGLQFQVPKGSRAKFEAARKACQKYQVHGGPSTTDQKDDQ